MWLLEFKTIWFWILIACAVLFAIFLVITLALAESGTKAKSKWLKLTICSFVVMTALIVFKPRENMEQVQYIPPPPPAQEIVEVPKDTKAKKSASKSAGTAGGQAGESQGASGKTQDTTVKTPEAQGKAGEGDSLQKKNSPNGGKEYRDPVLEEILKLKQQAEESSKESISQESSPATLNEVDQKAGEKSEKKNLQQDQSQKVLKASVLVMSLNVRDKGSMAGGVIGTLNTGNMVEVIDKPEAGEWVKIKLSNGQTGWVMKEYLKIL